MRPEDRRRFTSPTLEHADPPERLSPVAAELWTDISTELTTCGMLTNLDLTALEMLCESYADWAEARDELALVGGRYLARHRYDEAGNIVSTTYTIHPAAREYRQSERSLMVWLDAFGLTPAARLRWERGEYVSPAPEAPLDLSELSEDERAALRDMLERRLGAVGATTQEVDEG